MGLYDVSSQLDFCFRYPWYLYLSNQLFLAPHVYLILLPNMNPFSSLSPHSHPPPGHCCDSSHVMPFSPFLGSNTQSQLALLQGCTLRAVTAPAELPLKCLSKVSECLMACLVRFVFKVWGAGIMASGRLKHKGWALCRFQQVYPQDLTPSLLHSV